MRFLFFIVMIGFITGCGRKPAAVAQTQATGDAQVSSARIEPADPVSDAPATVPTSRPSSVILIDKKPYSFPPALLEIRNRDGQMTAVLMSDDPKEAINDNYHGNSFYLEMPLEAAVLTDLPQHPYVYSSNSNERTDSPNGIFLDGNRYQLEPADIQVDFSDYGLSMTLAVSGQFLLLEVRDDSLTPRRVDVTAKIDALVRTK